ncbi:MAG: serine/threonine-protein kinase [Labilithrix sp.]
MTNAARANLTAGKQITKGVVLVSPLSSGGMGAVWLADHQGLKTRVVVKFMLEDLGASEGARSRFSREAAAAAQVRSPHVVQMLDHGVSEDGVPFIVMEHLEGHDLGDEISKSGAMDPAKVVAIITQVAKALSKVHAAGLLHRDIKPDNIFLVDGEEEVFVKLLDFGIAKNAVHEGEPTPLDSETKTGQIVGTPFYMSPEQVTAQKTIDLRSDLWALGVVAYEALTGRRPFDGPSFGALAVKIATGNPPKPTESNPALPPSVDLWFARACAQNAADRFGSAKELADALRAAFEGIVSMPNPPTSGDSGARSVPAEAPRASGTNLPFAKTALDPSAPTKESPLARSEAGVSVHSAANSQRSSLLLLGGLVFVAVIFIGVTLTRGKEPPATTNSARPEPTAPVTVTVTVSVPTPPVTVEVPVPASAAADAGSKPPGVGPAVRPPAPTPAPAPSPVAKPEPAPKPAPNPRPPSSEPDIY